MRTSSDSLEQRWSTARYASKLKCRKRCDETTATVRYKHIWKLCLFFWPNSLFVRCSLSINRLLSFLPPSIVCFHTVWQYKRIFWRIGMLNARSLTHTHSHTCAQRESRGRAERESGESAWMNTQHPHIDFMSKCSSHDWHFKSIVKAPLCAYFGEYLKIKTKSIWKALASPCCFQCSMHTKNSGRFKKILTIVNK